MLTKIILLKLILCGLTYYIDKSLDLDYGYHNFAQMSSFLRKAAQLFPHKTLLYSIGNSTEGRPILVMAISLIKPLTFDEFYRRKNVKLIGNIHGDEAVGRELLLHFIKFALTSSNKSDYLRLKSILNDTIIHVLPSLNPDGFELAYNSPNHEWRGNLNGVDLNRNYPDYFEFNEAIMEPETKAIIDWLHTFKFVLSVSYHGGALVVSYPYDNKIPHKEEHFNPSDDDDVFQHLSRSYADTADNYDGCDPSEQFDDGITNGAEWYPVKGGMQDYNYINGVFELTIEVSCQKFPPASLLVKFWETNRRAIIKLLQETRNGLEGLVLDPGGRAVPNAAIYVDDRRHPVYTNKFGKFWRILRPNNYLLSIKARNFGPESFEVVVPDSGFGRVELRLSRPKRKPSASS